MDDKFYNRNLDYWERRLYRREHDGMAMDIITEMVEAWRWARKVKYYKQIPQKFSGSQADNDILEAFRKSKKL